MLQVRDGLALLTADLDAIRGSLATLAREHARDRRWPVARTASTRSRSLRPEGERLAERSSTAHAARLQACRPRVLVGQLAGAAGTLATLGERRTSRPPRFLSAARPGRAPAPWHVARDGLGELVSCLALLAAALERFALEIVSLQSTELAEVTEPLVPGHVGSSTMPQKRNPHACELAAAACKLLRGLAPVMVGCMVGEHERDMAAWGRSG